MKKIIAASAFVALALGTATVFAGTPKLKRISPNVYRIGGLGVEGIGISVPRAKINRDLKVTLKKTAAQKTVFGVWKDGVVFPLVAVPAGQRTATIPGTLVKKNSRIFIATSGAATTAFLVDGDGKHVNRGIVRGLFDKDVHVTLVNNTKRTTIGFFMVSDDDGEILSLAPGQKVQLDNGSDNLSVILDVPILRTTHAHTASFQFVNHDIGEPIVSVNMDALGLDGQGYFYSEGESHSYSANGFKYDVLRKEDTDEKEFVLTISND